MFGFYGRLIAATLLSANGTICLQEFQMARECIFKATDFGSVAAPSSTRCRSSFKTPEGPRRSGSRAGRRLARQSGVQVSDMMRGLQAIYEQRSQDDAVAAVRSLQDFGRR